MSWQLSKSTRKKLNWLLQNTGDMALKKRASRIIEEINPQVGDKILEVGCGDGFYLHLLLNIGVENLHLVGIDVDKNALRSARKNLKDKKVALKQADLMEHIPFKTNTFDKIIMSEVCEHLPDDVQGLKEVKRVLKKRGILVLTVPNWNFPFFWDPINWVLQRVSKPIRSGFWAGIWNQHLRLYKLNQIEKAVRRAGFKIKKLETLTWWCLPFNHYLLNFGARILARDRSSKLIQRADKFSKVTHKTLNPIEVFFKTANLVDKINGKNSFKDSGVSLFLKLHK